jgi:6-pyruvoyltetrahydropterin/6-carboxytetrahydropterin synthase
LRIHGHTYLAELTTAGTPDPESSMMIDLSFLRKELEKVRDKLDHHFLDEVPVIGPATLENLCALIYNDLWHWLHNIHRIKIDAPRKRRHVLLLP